MTGLGKACVSATVVLLLYCIYRSEYRTQLAKLIFDDILDLTAVFFSCFFFVFVSIARGALYTGIMPPSIKMAFEKMCHKQCVRYRRGNSTAVPGTFFFVPRRLILTGALTTFTQEENICM